MLVESLPCAASPKEHVFDMRDAVWDFGSDDDEKNVDQDDRYVD